MTNITLNIRQALTNNNSNTSNSVARLIADTEIEIVRVSEAVKNDTSVRGDVAATDAEHADAQQRLGASEILLERLKGAIPRLHDLRDTIIFRERDERQKAKYNRLVTRRNVVGKQLEEFLESLPAVATALHEAIQLKEEAKAFNVRPTPGTPLNPMDDMVSDYPFLPPLVTDAVLKRTRLVGSDGTVLFAPVDASVSFQPATLPHDQKSKGPDDLGEILQYEKDMQVHIGDRFNRMKRDAAVRGVSLEQVAIAQGINGDRLKWFQNIAEGKMVREAELKIEQEAERLEAAKNTTP